MFSLNFRYTDSPLIRSSIFNSLSIEIEITLRVLARELNAPVPFLFLLVVSGHADMLALMRR